MEVLHIPDFLYYWRSDFFQNTIAAVDAFYLRKLDQLFESLSRAASFAFVNYGPKRLLGISLLLVAHENLCLSQPLLGLFNFALLQRMRRFFPVQSHACPRVFK